MKNLLIIAYHFPPLQGSTGIHRILSYCRYLPNHSWKPTILTVSPRAYPAADEKNLELLPDGLTVIRAPTIDASRHLSIYGRYIDLLALPDKWQSWIATGLFCALRHNRSNRPDAIMATYPIASAMVIGTALSRMTKIPFIADFRDPMGQDNYPTNARVRGMYHRIEARAVQQAAAVTVTTPGTRRLLRERYRSIPDERFHVIENGFDPWYFPKHDNPAQPSGLERDSRPITLLHSGLLYPNERDPRPMIRAISKMKSQSMISDKDLTIVFRASGHADQFRPIIEDQGLTDIVRFLPPVPYENAIREMLEADALLVMQAKNCNAQIPAKLYEYMYSRKPILALTDKQGDTAKLLKEAGYELIADITNEHEITTALLETIKLVRDNSFVSPERVIINQFSREVRTKQLADLLSLL